MRDSVRETWLKKHGWQFEYREEIPLTAINVTESVRRQIRMDDKVDQDHVTRLGLALKDGAQLPAVMLADVNGQYELADGIHRYSAYQNTGASTLDAYVITNASDPMALEMLRRTANSPAVKGFTPEEAVRQAIALVRSHGWKPSEAAHAMQVSEGAITNRIRAGKVAERISKLAPTADYHFAVNTLDSLGRIQRDDLLKEAARISHQYRVSEQNARPMFTEASKVVTDAESKRIIDEWRQKYPVRTAPVESHEPIVRLKSLEARFRAALNYYDREKPHGAGEIFRWMASECLIRAAESITGKSPSGGTKSASTTRRKRHNRSDHKSDGAVHTAGESVSNG